MSDKGVPARTLRWAGFLSALFYSGYMFIHSDQTLFGIQYRFLTIWALTGYMLAFLVLLRRSYDPTAGRYDSVVAASASVAAVVVLLYWRLYFQDPSLVNGSREPIWFVEYYLHLVGPAMIWADAILYSRPFRHVLRTAALLVGVVLAYTLWIEFAVQPMNDSPTGSVTTGLPYPFLNNMPLDQRLGFYASAAVSSFVFLGIGWITQWITGAFFPGIVRKPQ